MEDIKLYNTSSEREVYDNQASLYSIIMSLEYLERAFARDSISSHDYTQECNKLLLQFKTASQMVSDPLAKFVSAYRLKCPAALRRLEVGIPSTIEHGTSSKQSSNNARNVAKIVQEFITVMDALQMNQRATDKLHPLLSELLQNINGAGFLPPDFKWKEKLRDWLIALNQMKASDELDEEQARELLFDIEKAYNDFQNSLEVE